MAYPIKFEGQNAELVGPKDDDTIQPLPVFRNGACCVSCWELTAEERAEIAASGRIFLSIFMGNTQPPVFIGSEEATRGLVADYGTGVWKR